MPLALLLFLICATLASIVLAASTTTAGQATTLKKGEQSYYAVTSAAKLFRDELNGQTVVIEQKQTGTDYSLKIDGATTPSTLLQNVAYSKMGGTSSSWNNKFDDAGSVTLSPLSLTATGASSEKVAAAVAVTATPSVDADGNITFDFRQGAEGGDSYELELKVTADVDSYEDVIDENNKTRITTVTWYANELNTP